MKVKTQKSIVLKRNFKNLLSILLPLAKRVISNQINKIKSRVMRKILPNKVQNTPKMVSNREIKSLENNFTVNVTKNIINTPKVAIEKEQIVCEPKVVTLSKITTKPKKVVSKPKIIDKSEIVIQKKRQNYDELKNRVIKQLKKYLKRLCDAKKK